MAPSRSSPKHDSAKKSQLPPEEAELQRKRARDRKSQQAMRDRNKWTIQTLGEQVTFLSSVLEQRDGDFNVLQTRLSLLEGENAHLRTQNAALQLSLLGRNGDVHGDSPGSVSMASSFGMPAWELHPKNFPPGCLADEILQMFVDSMRSAMHGPTSPGAAARRFPLKPNLASLLNREHTSEDEISNVVADVLRTYKEIESLPKQVAVFYIMSTLIKWMILLDKQSWDLIPAWLRPVPSQLATPHSAWIDRIPWPRAREYLIAHEEITLDDFAAPYSSGFNLNWPYDPESVILASPMDATDSPNIAINPVYLEHMRQIKHWTVGDAFRNRFPELTRLIDLDSGQIAVEESQLMAISPQQSVSSQASPPNP